ncbi:deoxyribodipyrimidine photo-lyase [Actinomadura nitritigenes]|uniref:deoxyribodipyrimidine photo-lyase n=1 Tax=Actinomadura nitritigenes TaxID=134602 RepID=UPI003D8E64C4
MFVFDDALLDGPFAVPNRVRFLLDALADLRESLRGLGGELVARRGDPVAEITCLARRTGAAEDHRRPAWGPHPVGRRPLPGVHPVLASLGGEPPASDRGGARGGPPAVRDPGRPLAGVRRPDAGHAVPRSCPRRRTGGTAAHGAMAGRGRRRLRRGPRRPRRGPDVAAQPVHQVRVRLADALGREGFMHNRARLITASFLTRTLGIDRRSGQVMNPPDRTTRRPSPNSAEHRRVARRTILDTTSPKRFS